MGHDGVLKGQEDADVAAGRIERADEGDHKQRPESLDSSEPQPGGQHQETCGQQGPTPRDPVGDQPEGERQEGGSQQRRSRDEADTEGIKYRAGQGGAIATQDLATVISYIFENADTLGVSTQGYS
ncbi:hypothetical protein [Microvirga ossetica]|uniref:hypothetical protein n=1 Tax=Microvirga ossetica TaxID=1882682 RepID=UPI0013900A4A|nr:hypothetical protein [Microvirga ossetica]